MDSRSISDDRYPIGTFNGQDAYTKEELSEYINQIAALPDLLKHEVQGMSSDQLNTPYREDGWTVRQVVHHLPDSHLNAYVRMKWTLTEEIPLIKAYDEKAWAKTPETKLEPEISLSFLTSLHLKWVALMRNLSDSDLKKEFIHPETKRAQQLDKLIAMYAWHGAHHLAHITNLKKQKGWK